MTDRTAFRTHPLDGALLHFQPSSGTHIRIENDTTRHFRRLAPRVVMFGVTNKCNLTCDFCSRDLTRSSGWTVASASATLQGLARAGSLEVAFGGGEPFAFRGFAELVSDLFDSTPLALNVTTNGTLISRASFAACAGRFGQVRVSIYPDSRWRDGCRILATYGQRWGANLIIDNAALATLPSLLAELVAMGCHDVSLLAYIGLDPRKHLSQTGRTQLAAIIVDAPIPCRLSVCFGSDIPVGRLFDGADGHGDCGAGLDFVTVTPDQKVLGCSFQDGGLPGANTGEILAAWNNHRLHLPSNRPGCARRTADSPPHGRQAQQPPIMIWQAYSGNNSGECVMVAKFGAVADANSFLSRLLPGWNPGTDFPPEWQQLFVEEGICRAPVPDWYDTPTQLLAIGRSVIAMSYGVGDEFELIRALAWKRGAYLVPGGIHLHGPISLLAAVRAANESDARELCRSPLPASVSAYHHGDLVLLTLWLAMQYQPEGYTLQDANDLLAAFAGNRPLAAEVVFDDIDAQSMTEVKKRLGTPIALTKRLAVRFYGENATTKAVQFAQLVSVGQVTVAGNCALVSGIERRKRLAVLAYRSGAEVCALDGAQVCVHGYLELPAIPRQKGKKVIQPRMDVAALKSELRGKFSSEQQFAVSPSNWNRAAAAVSVPTLRPEFVLAELTKTAQTLGAHLHVSICETDPLALALRRVMADVRRSF